MLLEQRVPSRENRDWTGVLSPLLYPGYKEWDRGLAGHLLIGWGMYTGWGKCRANTFSLWGRRGDTLYTVPLIVTTWEREGQQGSGFSVPAFQHPPWFYLLFCPWVTTLTRDWTWAPAVKTLNPDYGTTREFPKKFLSHMRFLYKKRRL